MAVLTSAKFTSPPSFPAKSSSHSSRAGKHELLLHKVSPAWQLLSHYSLSHINITPNSRWRTQGWRTATSQEMEQVLKPSTRVGSHQEKSSTGDFSPSPRKTKRSNSPGKGSTHRTIITKIETILQNFPALCAGNCMDHTKTCSLLSAWLKHPSVNDNFCQ